MGGKTQQRSGNVKPANSGRIRELLVSQQTGSAATPGNIITFSALSNKKIERTKTLKVDDKKVQFKEDHEQDAKETKLVATPDKSCDPSREQKSILKAPPQPPPKENYRLVVKRVGNRDLYTRVRFSDKCELEVGTTQPTVLPAEAGVKKPSGPLEDSLFPAHDYVTNEDSEKDDNDGDDDITNQTDDESEVESDHDVQGDFDELIGRLGVIRDEISTSASSLDETSEQQLGKELELLYILSTLVKKFCQDLSIEEWDVINHSLYKWNDWISKAENPVREKYQSNFSVKVFKFINELICFAENLNIQGDNLVDFPMLQSLLDDWANFHSSNMFQDLLILYFKLISHDNSSQTEDKTLIRPMIESMANIIIGVNPKLVLAHYSITDHLSSKVEFDPEFKTPENCIFCHVNENKFKSFLSVCGLLKSNFRVTLVSAHSMLSKSIISICENAIQTVVPAHDQEQIIDEDIPILPPAALTSILSSRDAIMAALLSDYRVGDTSVTIEPDTDAYACTLSYLFTWDLVIQFIVGVDKEIGQKIIHTLKKMELIPRLLDNIFILLPPLGEQDTLRFRIYKSITSKDRRLALANEQRGNASGEGWNLESFLKSPLRTTIKRPLNEIELIALHLYFSVALHMPVTVRKWYNNNSNKRLCNLVNEYTVKHVSRVICSLEMDSVQEKCQERASNLAQATNLTIKARPSAKEVFAIYHRDEFQMELTIKLPQNYPLGPVQIDGGKRVGVTDVKWRSWLLQLTTFLAHQNGPILDGIDLWRKNIDKRFEGVEKCTICFSILHSNYQLPKKKCQTCSNMFHNLCLFKWFESSGNSTCPLCRNPW